MNNITTPAAEVNFKKICIFFYIIILGSSVPACTKIETESLHVWETLELAFQAEQDYANPYTDVEMWVNLRGPENYNRRIWGFWDGGNSFKVRVTGISPGTWHWESASNQSDPGLNNHKGRFEAMAWTEEEKLENPNRRGFIEATASGHAWQYNDGTPFYMLADTWWGAPTWRYPFKGEQIPADYVPDSTNFCFEGGVQWLKSLGFNSIAILSALPNWSDDGERTVYDDAGILIRHAKSIHNDLAMTMYSDNCHRAFEFPGKSVGKNNMCPDYDRINPEYFKDMDRKLFFLHENGFVPYVETLRRDAGMVLETYHDFPGSLSRYINYIASRYGTMNMIFSLFHMANPSIKTISFESAKQAFEHWYSYYTDSKGMPFNQPIGVMGGNSTYENFGHITDNPWLQVHSVGNKPRDHTKLEKLELAMKVKPYIPGYSNEPVYVGYDASNNRVDGERPEKNSYRDNYLARAHAYGHMMNGGLAGIILGTGSRWCTGPGEEYSYFFPPPWETLHFTLLIDQARLLPQFLMSEGLKYRDLTVSNEDLDKSIRKREGFGPEKLEGWSHMVKTPDKKLALLYFEEKAQKQMVSNLAENARYRASWFDPREGKWIDFEGAHVQTDSNGTFAFPDFPGGGMYALQDWAAKLVLMDN